MSEVLPDGQRLIRAWMDATKALEDAKRNVNRAECNVANTRNAAAKWLLPEDAKPGEKIAVWMGDNLIQAEVPLENGVDVEITIRSRGQRRI